MRRPESSPVPRTPLRKSAVNSCPGTRPIPRCGLNHQNGSSVLIPRPAIGRRPGPSPGSGMGGKVAGNGCLMRTLPFSFVYFQSPDLLGKFSRETAFLTHPDPLAAEACHFYNVLAVGLLLGEEPWSAFKKARSLLQHEELARRLDSWPSLAVQDLRPTGYVVDSLEAALWCFFNGENIIEAIESAVNLGGDADTVAAICGGLAGTYWGWSALPDGWKSRLLIGLKS